ncbi:MAG: hypothetical protein JSR46_09290 [Verrucomicrobia bacterium]|nr:hypothetical protein [Verrucomicrobiota bacterium]
MHTIIAFLIPLMLFCSCTRHSQDRKYTSHTGSEYSPEAGYSVSLPTGWTKVTDQELIDRRVLWSIDTVYTRERHKNQIDAWDAPKDIDGFLTVMKVDLLSGFSREGFTFKEYIDYVICTLKENGVMVQETGTCPIDSHRSKWWVFSIGNGYLQQKCYAVPHKGFAYIFVFTTTYLSEEKNKLFDEIAKSVKFYS